MTVHSTAIVGCGRIAGGADTPRDSGPITTHAQAYRRHPAFRLDAVCDPSRERRDAFQQRWDVPRAYESLDALLRAEAPEVVSICSPTARHADDVRALCAAGVRVAFVEKPVCERPADLDDLRRRLGDRCAVLVNHSRRFDAAHRRAAELARGGALGAFVGGRADYYGGWLHNGSHLIDTIRMMVGEVAVEGVEAAAAGRPGDPCPDVTLRAGDAVIRCAGFDESRYQLFEIDLRFDAGRLLFRNFGEEIVVERVETNAIGERFLAAAEGSPWRGLEQPTLSAAAAIADFLDRGTPLAATGATLADAAQTMGVLWQASALR